MAGTAGTIEGVQLKQIYLFFCNSTNAIDIIAVEQSNFTCAEIFTSHYEGNENIIRMFDEDKMITYQP